VKQLFLSAWVLALAALPASAPAFEVLVSHTGGTDSVLRYDETGVLLGAFAPAFGFSEPNGIAFDSTGNVYVSNGGNRVEKFDASGNHLQTIGGSLVGPAGIAFDTLDNLYVAEFIFGGQEIEKFDSSGSPLGAFGAAELVSPFGVGFTAGGTLLVVDDNTGHVESYDTAGVWQGTFVNTLANTTRGLAIDSAGNVYVGIWAAGVIRKYTPGGALVGDFATGVAGVYHMDFDDQDNLYACALNFGEVHKIEPDGTKTVFASGISFPEGIGITPDLSGPAPAPGLPGWTPLLLAAAVLGAALLNARARSQPA
jgi:sugar lactone lactonase YvrE